MAVHRPYPHAALLSPIPRFRKDLPASDVSDDLRALLSHWECRSRPTFGGETFLIRQSGQRSAPHTVACVGGDALAQSDVSANEWTGSP